MKGLKVIGSAILALSVLAGLGYLLYFGLQAVLLFLDSIDSTFAAALVAASATVVVSVLSVLIAKHLDRRSEISISLRQQKVAAYQALTGLTFSIQYGEKLGKKLTEQEMLQRFAEMMPQLVTWADAGVITSFTTFRRAATSSGGPISVLFAMEEVYRAIRKDLGHDDNRLKKGDILGLFVNDVDKYL